jgi:hypothetical protein
VPRLVTDVSARLARAVTGIGVPIDEHAVGSEHVGVVEAVATAGIDAVGVPIDELRDLGVVLCRQRPPLGQHHQVSRLGATRPERGHDEYGSSEQGKRLPQQRLETFAAGSIVMNRRIDSFRSTTRPLTWEGVGVFFIKDGKIREWSDYTIRVTR